MGEMSTQSLIPQETQLPAASAEEREREQVAELRHLLLGSDRAQAARLREYLERIEPEELGQILPTAIRLRSAKDEGLSDSLMPIIASTLKVAVKRDPEAVAEAIFPVMGPAIRQYVWTLFNELVQQLDKKLQYGLSWQGLKWRIEAWQTKKSFGEIVLYHTLLYRVEYVYLIHKETGLRLEHVARKEVAEPDAEIESGMLTALKTGWQDLSHDIYGNEAEVAKMTIGIGEFHCWFAQGPQLILACIIRGAPPEEFFNEKMAPTIETIHREYATEIAQFEGDPAPFVPTQRYLEECLQKSERAAEEKKSSGLSPYLLVPVAIILLALGAGAFYLIRSYWRWQDYLSRLDAKPGIVITETGWRGGKYFVAGLRDPLAGDLEQFLKAAKYDVDYYWQPYQGLEREMVEERARVVLNPPPSVTLKMPKEGPEGVLVASGTAPQVWIEDARRLARLVPGVASFREDGLINEEILRIKAQMEAEVPRFVVGKAQFAPGQTEEGNRLIVDARRLFTLGASNGASVTMEVVGHTDDTGTVEFNDRLSRERAEMVKQLLVNAGLDASRLTAIGVGSRQPVQAGQDVAGADINRSVTFRVAVDATSQPKKP
jgi:flagellar motor protein MotB